jgi:hypothetical protein
VPPAVVRSIPSDADCVGGRLLLRAKRVISAQYRRSALGAW